MAGTNEVDRSIQEQNREITRDWVAGGSQPRDEGGRFSSPKPPESSPAPIDPPVPPATPPAAEAAPETPPATPPSPETPPATPAEEMIEFYVAGQDEPIRIPATAELRLQVNGQPVTKSAKAVRDEGQLYEDYQRKTTEVAQQRRQLAERERAFNAAQARMAAREQYLKEMEDLALRAQSDPEAQEQYETHLQAYRDNPHYRKMVDIGIENLEAKAELGVYREEQELDAIEQGTTMALGWIDELAKDPRFQGVSVERVRQIYGSALEREELPLERAAVEHIFSMEAKGVETTVQPLRDEVAQLKADLAAMKAGTATERHNRQTDHALKREGVPPVSRGTGAPAPATPKPERFGPRDLAQRMAEWTRQR